jgi:hypothetical protein
MTQVEAYEGPGGVSAYASSVTGGRRRKTGRKGKKGRKSRRNTKNARKSYRR